MTTQLRVVSIQIGQPVTYGVPAEESSSRTPWTSAIAKQPVQGPIAVLSESIEGDRVADKRFHGGHDKALLAYSALHYPDWRVELGTSELPFGAFGENLTIENGSEADVCIGDEWGTGELRLQVSQPRQPCWKLARRWDIPDLPKQVARTGRTGWYLRVLQTGSIAAGDTLQLLKRPYPAWTVLRANQALFDKGFSVTDAEELTRLPELAISWKEDLLSRLAARA